MRAPRSLVVCLVFVLSVWRASAAIPDSERQALLKFYQSTGGDAWSDKSGWGGAAGTECSWAGLRCDDSGSTMREIVLNGNNLTGTIPPELSALTNLEVIYLGDNEMSGPIPSVVLTFAKLRTLSLQNNNFSGSIPSNIGNMTTLTALELYGNELSGGIPISIGNLTGLTHLVLYDNELTGSIPDSIGQLTKLTYFTVGQNRLTGRIPTSLANLVLVEELYLGGNMLDGEIPSELSQLRNLRILYLPGNKLTGAIPAALGTLDKLENLELSYNELSGPIPATLGDLSSLKYLWLNLNKFSGGIPPELGRLSNLEFMNLDYSGVSGPIPPQLGDLSKLTVLALAQNALSGTIPPELSKLTKLEHLSLWGNQLSGTIPADLAKMVSLRQIELNENDLVGPIPDLSALTALEQFDVSQNPVGGEIPRWLGKMTKLIFIGMYDCQLIGTIPDELQNLKALETVYLWGNKLTGEIPQWIGTLPELTSLLLGGNRLTGQLPASITNLSKLYYLAVQGNSLSGPLPADLGRLQELVFFEASENNFSGPLPASISTMTKLYYVVLASNEFTGALPSFANAKQLSLLNLAQNHFTGTFPVELTTLSELNILSLGENRFTGEIPTEIGRLTKLEYLGITQNAFRGEIPRAITNLVMIAESQLDISYNALFSTDETVRAFLATRTYRGEWSDTQTIAPTNVAVGETTDRSAIVSWAPITYVWDEGGYRLSVSTTPGGTAEVIVTTGEKQTGTTIVRGLRPATNYYVTVNSVTHPHDYQQNYLSSNPTAPVAFTTGPRVLLPADVVMTKAPSGLIQVGGVPQNETSFILTNFGDEPTTLTLAKGSSGDFFEISPTTFILAAGASQTVRVTSLPKPAGAYWDGVQVSGTGVSDEVAPYIELLSVAAPTGTVIAEPLVSRIDVTGEAETTTTATVTYKNIGTSELSGVLSSDVPWIIAPAAIITIPPNELRTVNFTVDRRLRPDEVGEGALSGTLTLVYVDGAPATLARIIDHDTTPGFAISRVTVVDTTKPKVSASTIPSLSVGEIARFIPGMKSIKNPNFNVVSDVTFANAFGAKSLSDLRLYFVAAGSTSASVSPIDKVAPLQAFTVGNVASIYGASNGSLQVRSVDWDKLDLSALVTTQGSSGPRAGALPIFRSDRAVRSSQKLFFVGVGKSAALKGDLILQEVIGGTATASVEYLNASGNTIGAASTVAIAPFSMVELPDHVPTGAATAVVTVAGGSSGSIAGYVQMSDGGSGDSWSVVDWSSYFDYAPTESARIALAVNDSGETGRRRPIRRASALPATVVTTTDVYLFNRGTKQARGKLRLDGGSVDVVVEPRATLMLEDVVKRTFSRSGKLTSSIIYEAETGEMSISSRIRTVGGGTAVPVVGANKGLRLGESQVFAGVEDAQKSNIDSKESGSYKTTLVLQETAGESVKVRATLLFADGRSIVSTNISRDFDLSPRQLMTLDRVTEAVIGTERDQRFGDLHNVQLQLRVIEGNGAALPLVLVTESASGDSFARVE